jgi:hypothetical protein
MSIFVALHMEPSQNRTAAISISGVLLFCFAAAPVSFDDFAMLLLYRKLLG